MAQVGPDQYAEALCGCVFVPCGRGMTVQPLSEFKKRYPEINGRSAVSESELYNPADTTHRCMGRTNKTEDDSYEADYKREYRPDMDYLSTRQLGHSPTERSWNNFPAGMTHQALGIRPFQGTGHLPDLHDIHGTGPHRRPNADELPGETAESTPAFRRYADSRALRRRTRRMALEIFESEPPFPHTHDRQYEDNSSLPAPPRFSSRGVHKEEINLDTPGPTPVWQGSPHRGNYQRASVEDVFESPPKSNGPGSNRLTSESSNSTARNSTHRRQGATAGDLFYCRQRGTTRRRNRCRNDDLNGRLDNHRHGNDSPEPCQEPLANAGLRGGGPDTKPKNSVDNGSNARDKSRSSFGNNFSTKSSRREARRAKSLSDTKAAKNRNPKKRPSPSPSSRNAAKHHRPNEGSHTSLTHRGAHEGHARTSAQAPKAPTSHDNNGNFPTRISRNHTHPTQTPTLSSSHPNLPLTLPPILRPISTPTSLIILEIPRLSIPRRRNALPPTMPIPSLRYTADARDLAAHDETMNPHPRHSGRGARDEDRNKESTDPSARGDCW